MLESYYDTIDEKEQKGCFPLHWLNVYWGVFGRKRGGQPVWGSSLTPDLSKIVTFSNISLFFPPSPPLPIPCSPPLPHSHFSPQICHLLGWPSKRRILSISSPDLLIPPLIVSPPFQCSRQFFPWPCILRPFFLKTLSLEASELRIQAAHLRA